MKRLLSSSLIFAVLAQTASAQILAGWDLAGDPTGVDLDDGTYNSSFSLPAGTLAANLDGAALTLSSSVNPTTTPSQYGFKVSGGDAQGAATLATAIEDGNYLEFTLSASSGYVFTVTSIEMNGTASSTGADNIALLSSVDGYSNSAAIATATGVAGTAGGFDTDAQGFGGSITLTGMQYAELNTISFRIYGWNISSGGGITYLRDLAQNDLEVFGTVSAAAVPEPTSFATLAGLAMLGLAVGRRRRNLSSASLP